MFAPRVYKIWVMKRVRSDYEYDSRIEDGKARRM